MKKINDAVKIKELTLIKNIIKSGLEFANEIEIPQNKNPLPDMYLKSIILRTSSLTESILGLAYVGQVSDAQILMRVLVEIKINLDYLLLLISKEKDNAFFRILAAQIAHKNKLVVTVDWDKEYSKKFPNWDKGMEEIKSHFTKEEYKKIKTNGLFGCKIDERARLTKNSRWYNNVYRQYSQNIHCLDMSETLTENNKDYKYTTSRIRALMAMLPLCASSIFITSSEIRKLRSSKKY